MGVDACVGYKPIAHGHHIEKKKKRESALVVLDLPQSEESFIY
jgi:hypothetical protein